MFESLARTRWKVDRNARLLNKGRGLLDSVGEGPGQGPSVAADGNFDPPESRTEGRRVCFP